ncbi:23S rRNA (uracil-5-)-methyltransferase RumA [Oleispira antarctica]|uniref:23S rRNA (Uracil-5-)-methyltransferase RumA n=1 Tax=Oleispira antarctica TaxID=188908 RepID=A0A1Y5HZ39_OLEAN|nr:23S rRNA (uracil-5-)-methyltransferase RumA [Oleispira antarctica]
MHDLASDGHGIARSGRDVYFIPGALPGETVVAQMLERKRKIWYCRLVSIEQVSEYRIEPACPHYKRCGGCDLQHLSYPQQVELKQQRVVRELSRQGIEVENWQEPLVADQQWHYRRRARLGIRYNKANQEVFVGFRESNSKQLTNIDTCPVLVEHPALDWKAWRGRLIQLEGIARFAHIEVLQASERLVLVFRVLKKLTDKDRKSLQGWAEELAIDIYIRPDDEQPIEAVNEHISPLTHNVLGHDLSIHPDYFVQVNAQVNQLMVAEAKAWLAPEAGSHVWDLFAGHGNFSVPLAEHAVVDAVEVSDEMVQAIERHALQLSTDPTKDGKGLIAHKADLSDSASLANLPDPDYVLLDPPRAGASACMDELIKRKAKRMVYVSCDPATLARDLKSLSDDFDIERITILDMFPHTHHIETMVLLVPARKSSKGGRKMMNDRMKTQTRTKEKGASRGKSKR